MTYKPPKHHRVKVTEEKLGRQKALGIVDDPPYKKTVKVRIESRMNGLHKLDTTIHEFIHLFDPEIKETTVRKMATYLAKGLWKEGWRK